MVYTKPVGILVMVLLMTFATAATAFGATTVNQQVQVNVEPTVSINVTQSSISITRPADGGSNTTSFNVQSFSNVKTNITIIASALQAPAGTDPLTLANFAWVATDVGSGTAHSGVLSTTSQAFYDNLAKAPVGIGYRNVPTDLTVTVPYGADPGAYNTTITYSIVQAP